ncbi:potassium voltage-gated channel subfamily S member 1-like isoform X2 [Syngnathoides biaculeatus]|uniref:potassium voltage-gated channel subfamily S member 1-like isoform X2 n=1 Tax=Syngnathoides biaculeatus TaxID=300417 RepID=UPI002ADD99B6|nr:potassium voltage-gated channel subfamily S member 1-like isoform X2 [Syngnathoides biaculeatus]
MVTDGGGAEGVVHVNVGGLRRSVRCCALSKFPDTRLGKLPACRSEEEILQVCDDYDAQRKEFYFDRDPATFPYVLHFYRTGRLHVMEDLCVFCFSQEMDYWGVGDFFLDSCCTFRYYERKLGSRRRPSWDDDDDAAADVVHAERDDIRRLHAELQRFADVRCGAARKRLWLTLENPGYSLPGKLFSVVSVGVVLASLVAMCVKSVPEYQTFARGARSTVDAVEALSACWLTLEVLLRFLLSPNRKRFLLRPLNAIDVASVLPVYVTLVCERTLGDRSRGRPLQVFRLLRLFRVLKLARHSAGLRSLGATFRHSYREVGILLLYLAVGVSVFSGMVYTAEYQEVSRCATSLPSLTGGCGRPRSSFRRRNGTGWPRRLGPGHHPGVLVVGHREHDDGGLRRRRARHGRRQAGGRRLHPGGHPGGGAAHHAHLQQVLALLPPTEGARGVRPRPPPPPPPGQPQRRGARRRPPRPARFHSKQIK